MKLSKILCDKGMKAPLRPHEYLDCTVNPICHFKPIHAIKTEYKTMISLLITMISIAWGTDKPSATVVSLRYACFIDVVYSGKCLESANSQRSDLLSPRSQRS